jgi:hypothetical protein
MILFNFFSEKCNEKFEKSDPGKLLFCYCEVTIISGIYANIICIQFAELFGKKRGMIVIYTQDATYIREYADAAKDIHCPAYGEKPGK